MATHAHTTRRALLASAPAASLALAGGPAVALVPEGPAPLAEAWAEAQRLEALMNGPLLPDDAADAAFERYVKLEDYVLKGPITCKADALTKLRAVTLSFDRGERSDECETASQMAAIAWLEAH